MDKVINIFKNNHEQINKSITQEENSYDFDQAAKLAENKKKKLEEQRKKSNLAVLRSYRIKS